MDIQRRILLKAAMATSTLISMGCIYTMTYPRHAKNTVQEVIGIGGCGCAMVKAFIDRHPDLASLNRITLADCPALDDIRAKTLDQGCLRETVTTAPEASILIVAGLGGLAGGELSRNYVARRLQPGNTRVKGLLVLPFHFEYSRRRKAIAQLGQLNRLLKSQEVLEVEQFSKSPNEPLINAFRRTHKHITSQICSFLTA